MLIADLIHEECVLTQVEAKDRAQALRQTFEALNRGGYVKESFYEAVIERENNYPTGLELPVCGVAIPHVTPDHVLNSAVAVAVLKEPVAFTSMDDDEVQVAVKVIFNIALGKDGKQVDLLQELMGLITDETVMKKILAAKDSCEITTILRKVG